MIYDDFFAEALLRLCDERRYRIFANLEQIARCFPPCDLAFAARPA